MVSVDVKHHVYLLVDIIHQYWGRAAVVSLRKSCQFSDWRNSGFVVVDIVHHYSGKFARELSVLWLEK